MAAVLEISGLEKTYRSSRRGVRRALDGFDMVVEAGPGARLPRAQRLRQDHHAADAARPDPAQRRPDALLGQEVPAALPQVAGRVGAIVESPQFFPQLHRAGHAVAAGRRRRRAPSSRVDEVLELVGLRDRAKERVKTYSLGMKQRLAVASALLKKPDAADPRRAGQRPRPGRHPGDAHADARRSPSPGMTVRAVQPHPRRDPADLRLGHDHLARPPGRRRTGRRGARPARRRRRHGSGSRRSPTCRVAAEIADRRPGPGSRRDHDHLVVSDVDKPAWITRMLAEQGIYVSELAPVTVDLESVFLELTAHRAGATGQAPSGRRRPVAPTRRRRTSGRRAGGECEPRQGRGAPAVQAPVHPLLADPRAARAGRLPGRRSPSTARRRARSRAAAEAEAQQNFEQAPGGPQADGRAVRGGEGAAADRPPSRCYGPNCGDDWAPQRGTSSAPRTTCRTSSTSRRSSATSLAVFSAHPRAGRRS